MDIVCSWESFLRHSYSDIFNDYHFERFPSIPRDNKESITPDFTTYFNDEYGIIGEVKRTFPDDDVAFDSTLSQISGYDGSHKLKTADGTRQEPTVCDTLLIISGSSAPQIGTRLDTKLNDKNLVSLDSNLVLLRYQYNSDATLSRYEFQRVTQLDDEFRDGVLPDDISLSGNIGQEGNYGTLEVYPKHFTPVKAKKPLCNDHPPEPYLATILWHKVFPDYLSAEEFRQWRQGSAQKKILLSDTVEGFADSVDRYMHEGEVSHQWIADTLDYLCEAQLAERDSGEYEIGFRDLVRDVGEEDIQEGTQMLQQSKELAYMFINRYCEYSEGIESDTASQSGLRDFM